MAEPAEGATGDSVDPRQVEARRKLERLYAIVRSYGVSKASGRVVVASLDSPAIVQVATFQQLAELAAAARAVGNDKTVDFIVEHALAEDRDRLRELAGYLRSFRWDLTHWAAYNIRTCGDAGCARGQLAILEGKKYWGNGAIPDFAAHDDRRTLIEAIGVRLRAGKGKKSALTKLRSTVDQLVASAPVAHRGELRKLAQGESVEETAPELTPLETLLLRRRDLRAYQRDLVQWTLEKVSPDLDTRRKDAYILARRRLWYVDRGQVIRFLGQARNLSGSQIAKAAEAVSGLSRDDLLKVTNWLLGDALEDQKLWWIHGLGIGKWSDPGRALRRSSVLPGTFKTSFATARAPEITEPKTLPQVMEILDYWAVAARALPEVKINYFGKVVEKSKNRSHRQHASEQLERWKGGWRPPYWAPFLDGVDKIRADVAEGRQQMLDLDALAAGEGASEEALQGALGRGVEALKRSRGALDKLAPNAKGLIDGIERTRKDLSDLLRSELAGLQKKSWWQRATSGVWSVAVMTRIV